jgi:PAS domain S-box-containing protein
MLARKATNRAYAGTLRGIGSSQIDRAFEDTARLAAIVESSQDAIIGKTLAGVITSWNSGAERMYGYAADEIIGNNISELIPCDRAGELEPIIERVKRGESVQHFETQRVCKDGTILDMCVAISPIRDASGAVTGASTVARDVTEILRATTYRRKLEAELAHRVQSRALEDTPGDDLTPRELEVLGLLASGLINKQVARRLGLRLNTVRNHSQHILYKLHAHSRLEAVATAVRDGIIAYPNQAVDN